ncbi:DeoR/GlpR family DNA-binding transcription regulator [Olsenella porci]|uniref:DeoR/GlpR transcriptional regulator n=1 Tax=Olsenella porci TaxID=2652279 RepID=A0A6N7XRG7_9ACTN|nr:DeoR/GlpR family DNA-binding transcription regulator [Olsenella porci]MST72586.1 DeoR/GlpR transcriptional regulator [Olsenella porci]
MLAQERLSRIVRMVGERGTATVSDLAQATGASESTIRRDLDRLHEANRLVKVHGGAMAMEAAHLTRDLTLAERHGLHAGEKLAIARHAASLVGPDDFVYLDCGATVERLVDQLSPSCGATFATNSVEHAMRLAAKGLAVIVLGGRLTSATAALTGPDTLEAVARYHFTLGFWGSNGITEECGYTVQDRGEAAVKSAALAHCARGFVLADASKLGRTSLITYAPLSSATLVTSGDVPDEWARRDNVVVVPKEPGE